jgi:hypothetical protein
MSRRRATTNAAPSSPIHIRRFQPHNMQPDATILFVGPRRSGKSTLVMDLLFWLRNHIHAAIAQTPTCETQQELGKVMPWSCVHDDFDDTSLTRAINAMRQLVDTERQIAAKDGRNPDKRILLVLLDDCMADSKNMRKKIIQDIFYNGRHYDIMFINVQQYIMDMPNKLRTNIDVIIATYDSTPDNQERLWKYFFKTAFPDEREFYRAYQKITSNYRAIVLDRTLRGVPDRERIFWYKAQYPRPQYRVGHISQWVLHCQYLKSRSDLLRNNIDFIHETVRRAKHVTAQTEKEGADGADGLLTLSDD